MLKLLCCFLCLKGVTGIDHQGTNKTLPDNE